MFECRDGDVFYRLNRNWLDAHALYEPADEPHLADPMGSIVGIGGEVYVAEDGDVVVGTAAIAPHGDEWELLKVTVADHARGRGLGRQLVEHCIERARARGATRLVLVSNSKLQAALRLYERLGFTHAPLPADVPYATADVSMCLKL
jgi:ribosomal protein S18 acetylase RimI-like enzyme